MATSYSLYHLLSLFISLFLLCPTLTLSTKSVYIVHILLSQKPETMASTDEWYKSILETVSATKTTSTEDTRIYWLYSYTHAATGFAAYMTEASAAELRDHPAVLAVVPDQIVEPDTTHSYSFMGLSDQEGLWPAARGGRDIVIGVIDSGIYPESVSLHDVNIGTNVPAGWKGECEVASDFPKATCNNKVIGARSFYRGYSATFGNITEIKSARDTQGHGTHCASTAGGSPVNNANYHNYAMGIAFGVAFHARIASYKVFWQPTGQASQADILAAMDKAIEDGVHVLSMSLSTRASANPSYDQDPIAIGAFRAMERGVVVSFSAGNTGPNLSSVKNVAPWMLTVGASTMDRQFAADLVLGNNQTFRGSTLSRLGFGINSTQSMRLVDGASIGSPFCLQGELSFSTVGNAIVICEAGHTTPETKSLVVNQAGGRGIILVNELQHGEELQAYSFAIHGVAVTFADGIEIRNYVSSTSRPIAAINFLRTVIGSPPPAPRIASFSARGPNTVTPEILKPDIVAPGVNILAGGAGRFDYNILSGTSIACSHVSGLTALLRKVYPSWSPAAIKSAIMTTAYNIDNSGNRFIDLSTGRSSSPLAHGSGHIDPNKALNPGLVYDLDTADYVAFLCSLGYSAKRIAQFVSDPTLHDCSQRTLSSPGDLNYPSFSVVFNSFTEAVRYRRVVKNVETTTDAVYQVNIKEPDNAYVIVTPSTLKFNATQTSQTYTITFVSKDGFVVPTAGLRTFGSIEWSDGNHTVTSPIAAYWPYKGLVQEGSLIASM